MLSVLDPCTLIRVQTWETGEAVPRSVSEFLGLRWPTLTGTVASAHVTVFCTGPSEWLVIAADPDFGPLLEELDRAFETTTFRATNLSSSLSRLLLEGPHARSILAKGCSLDLHSQGFTPTRVARTRFAAMPVILHCTAPSRFELTIARSYCEYLSSWITDAAAEY